MRITGGGVCQVCHPHPAHCISSRPQTTGPVAVPRLSEHPTISVLVLEAGMCESQ